MITDEQMQKDEHIRRDREEHDKCFQEQQAARTEEGIKRLKEFQAVTVPAMREERAVMEREAVALYKQYGFFLPGPAKAFFRKLAIHLKWQDLMKVTK